MASTAIPNFDDFASAQPIPSFDEWKASPAPRATSIPGTEKTGLPPPPSPIPAQLQAGGGMRSSRVLPPLKSPEAYMNGPVSASSSPDAGLGPMLNGLTQAAAGVRSVVTGKDLSGEMIPRARGARQVIAGGLEALSPLAAPAMAAAPVASAVGLGVGMGTQKAVQGVAENAGFDEDTAGLVGDFAGIGAGGLVAKGAPRAAGKISQVKGAFQGEPIGNMVRGLKPRSTQVNFEDSLNRAMPELKVSETETKTPISSVDALLEAAKHAKQRVWSQYEQMMGPRATWTRDLSPVADAMVRSIPKTTSIENPGTAKSLASAADSYRSQFSLQEIEQLLQESNAELAAYEAKYPAMKHAALKANPETAATVAKADALRDILYGALDEAGDGAAAREVKRRYGSLSEVEQTATRRKIIADRQAPDNLQEQLAKIDSTRRIAGIAGRAVVGASVGGPLGAAAGIAEALVEPKVAAWLKERNSTNGLIKRAFENYSGTPGALDMPPPVEIRGQLGPGATRMPGTPDDSGPVRNAPPPQRNPGYWTPRQAPALSAPPIITPPPADTSGPVRGSEPMIHPTPPGRTLGPGSQPPRPDVLGSQGGDITDMIPAIDPRTGRTVYIPRLRPITPR